MFYSVCVCVCVCACVLIWLFLSSLVDGFCLCVWQRQLMQCALLISASCMKTVRSQEHHNRSHSFVKVR